MSPNNEIVWHHEKRKISDLRPYDKNPRVLKEKPMQDLKRSISKFGMAEPITIQPDGLIIGGHARYHTEKKRGTAEVDCWVPDREIQGYDELNVRLNKNIAGEWDWDILANEYDSDELIDWGFEESQLFPGNDNLNIDGAEFSDESEDKIKITISFLEKDLPEIKQNLSEMEKKYPGFVLYE